MNDSAGNRWLVRRPGIAPAALRLFCFPYAGVGASVYRLWQGGVPAGVEVCAVQLPGRETRLREAPLTRIEAIVDELLPQVLALTDIPFALFGHSMGAVIATALTERLAAAPGPKPRHLFVSGRRAPQLPDPDPPLAALSDGEFVTQINRRFGGIPAQVAADKELLALLLPCLRADILALETHRPTVPVRVSCPLTVYGGTADTRATREQLDAWRAIASDAFRVRVFDGDHFFLNSRRTEVQADMESTLVQLIQPQSAQVVPRPVGELA